MTIDCVKSRTWSKEGITVIARIMANGQHEVAIDGTVTMPMYYPGDAYDLDGNPVAFPRYHGRMLVKEMMDVAYYWIGENAPQPPLPRRMKP